jgi:hypothetical protein
VRDEVIPEGEVKRMRHEAYKDRPYNETFTDEEILADMARVAALVHPKPFSGPLFDKHTQTVSSVRVLQRFDLWLNAVKQAGITHYAPPVRLNYERTWSREVCIAAAREYLAEHPYGSYAAYEEWAREKGDKPSGGTLCNRVHRRWEAIREIALSDDA